MKTNNEKPTLEQLLASVEHAGRDARRQQQLSDMIEQLSEAEASRRSTVRRRVVRIAVAATITLFVTTSVWRWLSPSQPQAQQAALRPVVRPAVQPQPAVEPAASPVTPLRTSPKHLPDGLRPSPELIQYDPIDALEELESYSSETTIAYQPQSDLYAQSASDTTPSLPADETLPASSNSIPEAIAQAPAEHTDQPKRNRFFSLRMAEPSLMDGNVLALQIM